MQLPVIDLEQPDEQAAQNVHDACIRYGFLYITNHGIPQATIDAMEHAIRAFFALPLEAKNQIAADANYRGYGRMCRVPFLRYCCDIAPHTHHTYTHHTHAQTGHLCLQSSLLYTAIFSCIQVHPYERGDTRP